MRPSRTFRDYGGDPSKGHRRPVSTSPPEQSPESWQSRYLKPSLTQGLPTLTSQPAPTKPLADPLPLDPNLWEVTRETTPGRVTHRGHGECLLLRSILPVVERVPDRYGFGTGQPIVDSPHDTPTAESLIRVVVPIVRKSPSRHGVVTTPVEGYRGR